MHTRSSELRIAIAAHHDQRTFRAARYPPSLRAGIIEHATALRASGMSVQTISQELQIHTNTLRNWLEDSPQGSGFRNVSVVDDRKRSSGPQGLVSLVSPHGYRVEGLGQSALLDLLRELG